LLRVIALKVTATAVGGIVIVDALPTGIDAAGIEARGALPIAVALAAQRGSTLDRANLPTPAAVVLIIVRHTVRSAEVVALRASRFALSVATACRTGIRP
jgi:hypothetical protein